MSDYRRMKLRKKQKEKRDVNRLYAVNVKKLNPCVDCGESDPAKLTFDHIDPSTKSFTIGSRAGGSKGFATFKAEIAKCIVRCAACHIKKDHLDSGRIKKYKMYPLGV